MKWIPYKYLKERHSKTGVGKLKKSPSGIKLFYKINKQVNIFVAMILSNIFIGNLSPNLEEVIEYFRKREHIRKVLETF